MSLTLAIDSPLPVRTRPRRTYSVRIPRRRAEATRANRYLINVDFVGGDGTEWLAVGGGETLAEAIAAARQGLPPGSGWEVARWNHIHGD